MALREWLAGIANDNCLLSTLQADGVGACCFSNCQHTLQRNHPLAITSRSKCRSTIVPAVVGIRSLVHIKCWTTVADVATSPLHCNVACLPAAAGSRRPRQSFLGCALIAGSCRHRSQTHVLGHASELRASRRVGEGVPALPIGWASLHVFCRSWRNWVRCTSCPT